jgi:uncharacterized membrane protein
MPDEQPLSRSDLARNVLIAVLFLGIIPLAILAAAMIPPARMVSFIGAILVFQPFAAPIGLVLGIPPLAVFLTMLSVGLGAVVGILTLCDLFAQRWERLTVAIQKVQATTRNSVRFRKYGILMFFQFIWVPGLGLYGCAVIAWLFAWRRLHHFAVLMAAWMVAVIIVMIVSLGISIAVL